MQHAWQPRAFVGHGSGFCHAVMIEDPRAVPQFLQARPQGGDAPPGFAGDDDRSDGGCAQADLFLRGYFGEAERVGGCAA